MKVKFTDDKIIVYLYKYLLSVNDVKTLNVEIKNLFVQIIQKYHISFYGYFKVSIYHNVKYGCVLEIENIASDSFFKITDLKIIVYRNSPMYLVFDNYYDKEILKKGFFYNNKFYLNIDSISNITKYIEYADINYCDNRSF